MIFRVNAEAAILPRMTQVTRISAVAMLVAAAACHPRVPLKTPASTAPQNRPPAVRLRCEPCTVPAGQRVTVSADATDPDADALSYAWTAPSGTLATASARQTIWTAPAQEGPVPVAITVSDGKGGVATDAITIQVTKPGAAAMPHSLPPALGRSPFHLLADS